MNIKISIIIPVFNSAEYLSKSLESAISYNEKDIEIIIINDGSTDSSLSIIQKYLNLDTRIILINLNENKGLGHARNIGIKHANGQYIFFMDSDDWLQNKALNEMISKIEKKYDVILFGTKKIYFKDPKNQPFYLEETIPSMHEENPQFFESALLSIDGFEPMVWCYLFSKNLILENNIKFEENIFFEDIPFTTKMLFYTNNIGVIPKALYNYRIHQNSITRTVSKKKIEDNFYSHNIVREFLIEKNVFERYEKQYVVRMLTCCLRPNFISYFKIKNKDVELKNLLKSGRHHPIMSNESLSILIDCYKYCFATGNKGLGGFYRATYLYLFFIRNAWYVTNLVFKVKSTFKLSKVLP